MRSVSCTSVQVWLNAHFIYYRINITFYISSLSQKKKKTFYISSLIKITFNIKKSHYWTNKKIIK